ncbi:type II toxin-antitoxin system ParD family antitoxin [Leucobacter sp. gxy201]|uniref:type II toxin-antitoxin system ParD family antitoxin n=1 Tax=Leucobacter sp. gxy201 TaxID=2957200 RepID=UPI003DA19CD8
MATMNISLSDELKEFVEHEVHDGAYTSASEYMRQLIREKREEAIFRQKILDGMNSPLSTMSSEEIHAEARRIAREHADA